MDNDTLIKETYQNLTINANTLAAAATYMADVIKNSNLITIEYQDLSAQQGQLRPTNATYALAGGADGSAPVVANYTGTPEALTGFYAFNPYDDSYALACPDISEGDMDGLAVAGEAYAALRKDLLYYQHLDNSNITAATLIAEKPSMDSQYIVFTAGGLLITHPISSEQVSISELGDVLGNMAYVHKTKNVWTAFTNYENGKLTNALGVVTNFGSAATFTDLDLLAQSRVNMVISRSGSIMFWDDYTAQVAPSPENFACLMNLIFYIQKVLKPTLERFLGKPTDFQLLRDIFYMVEPFFKSLTEGRALSSWEWQGDQFATSFDDLEVNNSTDMGLGRIKVNLRIVTIAPLKEISVNIILTRAGVTFEF